MSARRIGAKRSEVGRQGAPAKPATRKGSRAETLLFAGVVLGSLVTPLAMLGGGTNPFGPAKALTLSAGVSVALVGLFLAPTQLADVLAIVRRSRLAWALAAFLALGAVSTAFAYDRWRALLGGYPDYLGFLTVLACAALGVCWIAVWRRSGGSLLAEKAITVSVFVAAFFAVLQRVGVWRPTLRVGSLLGNPSNFGVYLLVAVPMVVLLAVSTRSKAWRVFAALTAFMSVLALFWTLSRGAWVGAVAAVVAAVVLSLVSGRFKLEPRRIGMVAGSALAVALLAALLTPGFAQRALHTFDTSSATAKWRIETWTATTKLVASRPMLGWGLDNFRYVYRFYQPRGQVSTSSGYDIVESSHSAVIDSAASLGVAGLALVLLVVALAARRLVTGARTGPEPTRSVALAASLVGALVAMQFHYVTMDTGAILAMVLAAVISTQDPVEQRVSEGAVAAARWSALATGCAYASVACFLVALVAADATSFAATRRILGGAAWEQASGDFSRVRRLAPWEPRLARSEGEAATAVVLRGHDASAYRDGLAAFDRAGRMHPGDPVVAAERANLILNAGIAARDKAMLAKAERAFAEAEAMDPGSGVIKVGRATALLSLGETARAIQLFKSGLERSPNYRSGWKNLALAYERIGETTAAEDARRRGGYTAP